MVPTASFLLGGEERVFLFGPSGSGKTTLLGVLAGILTGFTGSSALLLCRRDSCTLISDFRYEVQATQEVGLVAAVEIDPVNIWDRLAKIVADRRIGISAGRELEWRFLAKGHPGVSVKVGKGR